MFRVPTFGQGALGCGRVDKYIKCQFNSMTLTALFAIIYCIGLCLAFKIYLSGCNCFQCNLGFFIGWSQSINRRRLLHSSPNICPILGHGGKWLPSWICVQVMVIHFMVKWSILGNRERPSACQSMQIYYLLFSALACMLFVSRWWWEWPQ